MRDNKLASLEATLVRNSAHLINHLITYLLTGVKCRATSVAKKNTLYIWYTVLHNTAKLHNKMVNIYI